MKQRPTIFLLLLLFIAPVTWAVDTGDQAPAWKGIDVAGNQVVFPSAGARQPTVIVFWATWCNYCRAFMPYLAAIQEEYGVQVMAINAKEEDGDEDTEQIDPRAYIDQQGFDFITVLDGDAIAANYDVDFIPGLFVIDADGKIIYRRGWTELPAGHTVAQLWDGQVRSALNKVIH